ncbi:MAG: hypothetical protein EOM16_01490 [Bacteroidia bacterium]|jgi:hypothetical protein|nr:hypothetical protein [Bacteroidales bacterium]MDD3299984.1 hypothetical protein [Bacteroidales bacterium]MDD3843439.1 hypothetical protein [Bacteroidales bacterium]MDD4617820.1 hypothetical protein [Bacteroidales bacterium]NCC45693.1 hypothetical protein [Bacteroidia bacterium]
MKNEMQQSAPAGAVYGLGLIGTAIYFIMNASGFWAIVTAILKAIVWPAILTYELLSFIGA